MFEINKADRNAEYMIDLFRNRAQSTDLKKLINALENIELELEKIAIALDHLAERIPTEDNSDNADSAYRYYKAYSDSVDDIDALDYSSSRTTALDAVMYALDAAEIIGNKYGIDLAEYAK